MAGELDGGQRMRLLDILPYLLEPSNDLGIQDNPLGFVLPYCQILA